jgi:glyoxylase-like metal-dependent hydrolase (beta-lactamase superfamily II)
MRVIASALMMAVVVAGTTRSLQAQDSAFSGALLRDVRARARAIPGPLPQSVGYLSAQEDSAQASDAVTNAQGVRMLELTPVFQIRYKDGWIMVDGAMDRAMATRNPKTQFNDSAYARIQAALRGAGLIVATHEHLDHVGTLVKSSIAAEIAPHTLFTRQQIETMVSSPKIAFISLDSAAARRYLVVDYDRLLPIAPGVVLIRAAGHTPGSQMVYVRLANGREIMLIGDVAWLHLGVQVQNQKPDSVSQKLHEDRVAIAQQLAWLKYSVEGSGITVVVSHDGAELILLAHQGILTPGLDLGERRRGDE